MSEAFYQLEREFVVHSSFLSFVTVCSQATRTFHWGRKLKKTRFPLGAFGVQCETLDYLAPNEP